MRLCETPGCGKKYNCVGLCKSCYDKTRKERNKEWARNNRPRLRESERRYKLNHPDKHLEKDRRYRERHREQVREYMRNYCNENREHIRALKRAYETRLKQATPPWLTPEQKHEMYLIYKNRPEGHHVDHRYPLNGKDICGLHVPWNLQYLPAAENLRKSNKVNE